MELAHGHWKQKTWIRRYCRPVMRANLQIRFALWSTILYVTLKRRIPEDPARKWNRAIQSFCWDITSYYQLHYFMVFCSVWDLFKVHIADWCHGHEVRDAITVMQGVGNGELLDTWNALEWLYKSKCIMNVEIMNILMMISCGLQRVDV